MHIIRAVDIPKIRTKAGQSRETKHTSQAMDIPLLLSRTASEELLANDFLVMRHPLYGALMTLRQATSTGIGFGTAKIDPKIYLNFIHTMKATTK